VALAAVVTPSALAASQPSGTSQPSSTSSTRATTSTTRATTTSTASSGTTTQSGSKPKPAPKPAEPDCTTPFRPPVKRVDGLPHMGEVSGLAASKRHPGWGWMIRDSGHPPFLYSLRFVNGEAQIRTLLVPGATNRDWEDVNYSVGPDGQGRIWVVESGQSGKNRYIYEILEPDPATARIARLLNRYSYAFPDLRRANVEASFIFDGDLVLVTKTNPPRLYRFDKLSPGSLNKPALQGTLQQNEKPSMARVSPDKRFLVNSTHQQLFVYENKGDLDDLRDLIADKPVLNLQTTPRDNVESGDFFPWGSCDLLLLAESHNFYWIRKL
jgi:hypothetical protein